MILFLTIIHILVALLLVLFVLIQDSKGEGVFGMGGGGGGSNKIISSTGAGNFLVKMTRGLAIVFAFTSITLTYLTSKHEGSVTDTYVPPPAAAGAPVNGAKPADAKPSDAKSTDGKPADPNATAPKAPPAQEPKAPEGDD